MSQNLTVEVPEVDFNRFKALLGEWLELLTRMAAERPLREQEDAEHNRRFRENMDVIWVRIESLEKAH